MRRSRASQEMPGGADGLTAARSAISPPGGSEERRRLPRAARHDTAHEADRQAGWLALLEDTAGDLQAAVTETGRDAGWLCGWRCRDRPHPAALRVDERLLAADGAACRVSLVLLPKNARLIADDPMAIHARRAALRAGRLVAVSILTHDPVHLAGAVTVARADRPEEIQALADDPFARLGPVRLLDVGPGVLGWVPLLVGPVVERYAGAPWPYDKW